MYDSKNMMKLCYRRNGSVTMQIILHDIFASYQWMLYEKQDNTPEIWYW